MKIAFIPDVHLGKSVAANTTPSSRKRWSQKIASAFKAACYYCSERADLVVQCGDLFDTYSNKEATIVSALRSLLQCDHSVVLAGNHDLLQNSEAVGSLQLLHELSEALSDNTLESPRIEIVTAGYNERKFQDVPISTDVMLHVVPHHTTRAEFKEALADAIEVADKESWPKCKILVMHTNLYMDEDLLKDTELNLSYEEVAELREVYNLVVTGHIHEYSHVLPSGNKGHLLVTGVLLPTTIGEAALPCQFFVYDTNTDELELISTYRPGRYYRSCHWKSALELDLNGIAFVSLTGSCKPSETACVSAVIAELWKDYGDSLLAVRNAVEVEGELFHMEHQDGRKGPDFRDAVAHALGDEELVELFKSLLQEVEEQHA